MNVLSLFDGISCGRVALERAGIEVERYYASEIDKFAIKVSESNYPDIIRLGDVTKWKEWNIDWGSIDLVTAGFPCQSWSLAGKQLGDKDPRGALFWTTLDIIANVLKYNPSAKFLMENVRMKKEFEDYITHHTERALGYVEKTLINSALLSAQNRNRFYWTNFKVEQPEDKGILLKDILEEECLDIPSDLSERIKSGEVASEQNLTGISQTLTRAINNGKNPNDKGNTLTACAYKGMGTNGMTNVFTYRPCELLENETAGGHIANATDIKRHQSIKRVYNPNGKAPTLTTMGGGHREPKVLCGAMRGRYLVDGKRQDHKIKTAGLTTQKLEIRSDEKTNCLTTVQKDNVLTKEGAFYRKLTPLECERLQTLPDNFTAYVSNTQRYKAIGNGWTVDVIAHILSFIK